MVAASRYGYRGSKQLLQYFTQPYEIPAKTVNEHTPKFLQAEVDFRNEYVPNIYAATVNSINGMETPKLWPDNAEYVNGYRKKKMPLDNWKYKRQTTVVDAERPQSSTSLTTVLDKIKEDKNVLSDYARMESERTLMSFPMTMQAKFDVNWKKRLETESSSSLRRSMNETKAAYNPQTLMDPSDSLKYSGSTAMIIHSQTTEELKFRLRMERSKSKLMSPYQLKWQHIITQYDNISTKLKRNQTMTDAIKKIADTLREIALKSGSETSLRRLDFVKACSRITYFEDIASKHISQTFSIFDPLKKDCMRFVELILHLVVLDKPEYHASEKISLLWQYANEYGLDRGLFDIAFDVLTCCAGSLSDLAAIESAFKEEFRPRCYEFAVMGHSKAYDTILAAQSKSNSADRGRLATSRGKERDKDNDRDRERMSISSPLRVSIVSPSEEERSPRRDKLTSSASKRFLLGESEEKRLKSSQSKRSLFTANGDDEKRVDDADEESDEEQSKRATTAASKRTASLQQQYNICEQYLNETTLTQVLRACPRLMDHFDRQLHDRLLQCYGKDERPKPRDEDSAPENLDFTWIMKKAPIEREKFGLF